jgi:hypothetical protein
MRLIYRVELAGLAKSIRTGPEKIFQIFADFDERARRSARLVRYRIYRDSFRRPNAKRLDSLCLDGR